LCISIGLPIVSTPTALELIEDGVVLVEGAKLGTKVVVDVIGFHRL